MIIPDSRKTAATIIADLGSKPKMPEPMEEKTEDDGKEGMVAIAEDIIKAIEMKDANMLAMALCDFNEMCGSKDEMPEVSVEDEI